MFAKRLISSIALWAILLSVIFYLPPLAGSLFYCLISTLALWEFYDMLERGGQRCAKAWGLAGGILLSSGIWWFAVQHQSHAHTFEVLLLVCLVVGLFIRQLADRENSAGIQTIGNTLLGVLYIPWLFGFIPKIKFLYPEMFVVGEPGRVHAGSLFVFYLVIVTKCCDIGAYGVGRLFGRHKMIPRISPNKTWEGFFGGLVVALIASITAFEYLRPRVTAVGFHHVDALVLGVLLGLMGVVGDLAESMLKRETNVKDSGGVLPGIGGALDLIDSLIFTAPVLYAYLILRAPPQ